MLKQLSDLIELAVLILLVLRMAAWIAYFFWPQAALPAVTGRDSWGRTPTPS